MKNTDALMAALREALEEVLAWRDAVPSDLPLPTMPGFNRDAVDELLALSTPHPTETRLREALERSKEGWENVLEFRLIADQHRDTARALADEASAALSTLPAQPVQPEAGEKVCPGDGNILSEDGVCGWCGNAPEAYEAAPQPSGGDVREAAAKIADEHSKQRYADGDPEGAGAMEDLAAAIRAMPLPQRSSQGGETL
ncbi:hypothetical protein SCLO_1017470 [Sphingobium cloacae]|uniref:Uncharacterized protein n=2 Tax=Sphingobium cloacae TaxID=120107 RepID=A0A1E1F2N0_9SPHN|nr:hypothetical protein SCLO_1017470 [Sphingobium cloacae]